MVVVEVWMVVVLIIRWSSVSRLTIRIIVLCVEVMLVVCVVVVCCRWRRTSDRQECLLVPVETWLDTSRRVWHHSVVI